MTRHPQQVQLEVGGLSVIGQAVAIEAGAAGEKIHVQNLSSHALLTAQVVGPGAVRVMPDALPVLAGPQTRFAGRIASQ